MTKHVEEQDFLKILDETFPEFEQSLKEQLLLETEIVSLKEGDELVRPGQYIRSTMLVVNGLLKVVREDEEGNEFLLYYLEPGSACALSIICVANQERSEVMVKAMKDSDVIRIPFELTHKWMEKYHSWYKFVIETYRKRFEEVLNTLDQVAFKALDERLLFFLKRHSKALNNKKISLTHAEIAKELNSSREVISRLLKKLEQKGAVRLNRNYIKVVDLELMD